MTRLFLAPRSNEETYKKNESSILQGVAFARIAPQLSDEGRRVLGSQKNIFAWGNQPGKASEWEKIALGDWVLFYEKGNFTLAGRVTHKEHKDSLALAIWPRDKKGNPWEYTFFFEKLNPINLSLGALNVLADYHFVALMGFQEATDPHLQKLLVTFGSIENFLETYGLDPARELEGKTYVNIPEEVAAQSFEAQLAPAPVAEPAAVRRATGVVDFEERNRRSGQIGSRGEEVVLKFEQDRLRAAGRPDLAEKVDRVSLAETSAGFDILSFDETGEEKRVEVKATVRAKSKKFTFGLSRNELRVAQEFQNYAVYLVFAVETDNPLIYVLGNPYTLREQLLMVPTQFIVKGSFK